MRTYRVATFIGFAFLFLAACSAYQNPYTSVVRPAKDTPDYFSPSPGVILDATSCKSPLIDPRDGTKLTMVGAENGIGLYSVPDLKYGLNEGEVLKVNCSNGIVLGIVKWAK